MNFLKKNQTIIIALVVICVVGYYLLVVKESFEGEKKSGKASKALVYFWMKGCPHCVKFKGEWEKVAKACQKNKDLNCKDYEARDKSGDKLRKLNKVQGFPTIVLHNRDENKKGKMYNGPRNAKALLLWAKKQ